MMGTRGPSNGGSNAIGGWGRYIGTPPSRNAPCDGAMRLTPATIIPIVNLSGGRPIDDRRPTWSVGGLSDPPVTASG